MAATHDTPNTPDTPNTLNDIHGPVIHPGEPGYADEVTGFNLAALHTPDVVVGATRAEDIVIALRWASATHTPVTVQATGHGANFPIENGLLINTTRMTGVRVDEETRTARIDAGAKWRHVLAAATPHGLATLNGSSTDAGVVGYILGGGLPVLGRTYGYAADKVRSFEVATPDGTLHHTDADTEPDLFWALRGGKGNVGVVTSLVTELLPLPRVLGGGIYCAGEDAEALLTTWATWTQNIPPEMNSTFSILRLPPFPEIPEPFRGGFWARVCLAWTGETAAGQDLSPAPRGRTGRDRHGGGDGLRGGGPHLPGPPGPAPGPRVLHPAARADTAGDRHVPGPGGPGGGRRRLPAPHGRAPAHGRGAVPPRSRGGRGLRPGRRVPPGGGGRPGGTPMAEAVERATTALNSAMAAYGTGRTLVNLHGTPGDEKDRARAWTPEVYDRLRRAKSTYDPENLLRYGHTVAPSA